MEFPFVYENNSGFLFFHLKVMDGISNFISLRGIKKIYGGSGTEPVYALRGVDLDIED